MTRVLKFRLSDNLDTRLEDAASRSARTRSDVAKKSVALGLAALAIRIPPKTILPRRRPEGVTTAAVYENALRVQTTARDILRPWFSPSRFPSLS